MGLSASFFSRAGIIFVACMPFWTYPLGFGTPLHGVLQRATSWLHEHAFRAIGFDLSRLANADVASKAELALAGALLWLVLDRRRRHEAELMEVLRLGARFALGGVVVGLGLVKVFPIQMHHTSAMQLIQPLAEPDMWPAWGLMSRAVGASPFYQMYTGWLEVLSGALLFFRRTAILGTFLVAIELILVIAMTSDTADFMRSANFNWIAGAQVPALAILVATYWRPFVEFFVMGRAAAPPTPPAWPWFRRFESGLRVAFAIAIASTLALTGLTWLDRQHRSPLEGVYDVETFSRDGESRFEGPEAASRWRVVAIGCVDFVARTIDDVALRFDIVVPGKAVLSHRECAQALQPPRGGLTLQSRRAGAPTASIRYAVLAPDRVALEGTVDGQPITAELRRKPMEQFALLRSEGSSGEALVTPALAALVTFAVLALGVAIGGGCGAIAGILSLAARYVLAAALVGQGTARLMGHDSGAPSPVEWIRPLGDFTKCEIAHLWQAYPPLHTILVGMGETVAGIMLLPRRTALLGAFIGAIGMMNLTMVGLAFCGGGAAMRAAAFTALAVSILIPERRRLMDFLVRGRQAIAAPSPGWPGTSQGGRAALAVHAVAIAGLVAGLGYAAAQWKKPRPMSPLRGVYRVETFTRDGRVEPLAAEWPARWRVLAIGNSGEHLAARTVDGREIALDMRAASMRPEDDRLVVQGRFPEGEIAARLVRMDNESFSFYHWLPRE